MATMNVVQAPDAPSHRFTVKPGYHKGGRGPFARVASPCEFVLAAGEVPTLAVGYHPQSNLWIALAAAIITAIVFEVIAQVPVFIPGLITWYLIIDAIRKETFEINLMHARRVVLDPKKKEVGILITFDGKDTWVGVRCHSNYEEIVSSVRASGEIQVEEGSLKTTHMRIIIVAVVVVALVALVNILDYILD